jgi:hypothetical protein
MRRRLIWVAVLLLVVGVAGWFGYDAVAKARRESASQREDAERLRVLRYEDVLRDLDTIGDGGDETARTRCRHAIELLAAMEPDLYRDYRRRHPAPDWLAKPSPPGA